MMLVSLEGVLRRKKGDLLSRWSRTIVLLAGDHLYGFATSGDRDSLKDPVFAIDLVKARVSTEAPSDNDSFPLVLFCAMTDATIVELAAGSLVDRERWRAAIVNQCAAPPVLVCNDSTIEGYLTKRGANVRNWKQRYFVIRNGALTYMKAKVSREETGTIPLVNATVVTDADRNTRRPFSFGVTPANGRRTYWISAGDEEERNRWLRAIISESFGPATDGAVLNLPDEYASVSPVKALMNVPVKVLSTPTTIDSRRLLIYKAMVVISMHGPADNESTLVVCEILPLRNIWLTKQHDATGQMLPYAFRIGREDADEGAPYVVGTETEAARHSLTQLVFNLAFASCSASSKLYIYGERHMIMRGTVYAAAFLGDSKLLGDLLGQPCARIDGADEDGCTALHLAVHGGHSDCVALLVNGGADISIADGRGDSALHIACRRGDLSCVTILIERDSVPLYVLNLVNADAHTPLWTALFSGMVPALECSLALIRRGVHPDTTDLSSGATPLVHAAKHDLSKAANLLLDNDASLFLCFPLHVAVANNALETARVLLSRGALPNLPDWEGRSPIQVLASSSSNDMRRLLLEFGARVGSHPHDPLFVAASAPSATSRHPHYEWVEDRTQNSCQACGSNFGLFVRRHHCRHCGSLCCSMCTTKEFWSIIDNSELGVFERACDGCFNLLCRLSAREATATRPLPDIPASALSKTMPIAGQAPMLSRDHLSENVSAGERVAANSKLCLNASREFGEAARSLNPSRSPRFSLWRRAQDP